MATLYIAEAIDIGASLSGAVPAILEPLVTSQTVAIGGSSVQSSAFAAAARVVELHCDVACHIAFGENPTATTASMRLGAGERLARALPARTLLKVAVIQAS